MVKEMKKKYQDQLQALVNDLSQIEVHPITFFDAMLVLLLREGVEWLS